MEKSIIIDGKEILMEANASTPRKYRAEFGKELFLELSNAVSKSGEVENLEVFENLAFIMAKQAGSAAGDIETWLASFDSPMAITTAIGGIMALWNANTKTIATAKKKVKTLTDQ